MEVNAAYILPTPIQILQKSFGRCGAVLFTVHLPATMLVTLWAFAISLVLGLGLAILMDASTVFRKAILPGGGLPDDSHHGHAPLFVLWFGYGI